MWNPPMSNLIPMLNLLPYIQVASNEYNLVTFDNRFTFDFKCEYSTRLLNNEKLGLLKQMIIDRIFYNTGRIN